MIAKLRRLAKTKFVRDTATIQIATLVQGGTYLITSVLTARYLGAHELGRWVTTRELYMFAWFLVSTGVLNATIKAYSQAQGAGDSNGRTNALAALLKLGAVSSVLVGTIGWFLGPLVGEEIYGDREVGVFAGVLCVSGLFEVLRTMVVAALMGSRQMKRYAVLDIVTNLLRVGLVWGALLSGFGVKAVVVAYVGHMVLAATLSFMAFAKARRSGGDEAPPALSDVFRAIPSAPLRHIFGLAFLISLNKQMNTLVPRLGMLLIPATQLDDAMSDNGAYNVAQVLAWALALALTGVSQSLLPALGHKLGTEEVPFEKLGKTLRRITLVSGGLMAGVTLLTVPIMYFVIEWFYGGEEFGDSFQYYLWLTAGNLTLGFFVAIESFYIYSGKIKKVIPFNLLLATTAATSVIVATKYWGASGAAAAGGLCRNLAFFHLLYMWWYFSRARRNERTESGEPRDS